MWGGWEGSADKCRRERLPAGEADVLVVPELHGGLTEPPAEKHAPSIELAREVDETDATVLELDAERLELRLERIDVAGDVLCPPLERHDAWIGQIRPRLDCQHIELGDRLLPAPMLAHHVLDDAANQRKRAI